jgi:hypothetical protein
LLQGDNAHGQAGAERMLNPEDAMKFRMPIRRHTIRNGWRFTRQADVSWSGSGARFA